MPLQPLLELRRGPQVEQLAGRGDVVERVRLIVQHDVIPHRQGDDEIDPGDGQQEHQVLVGILVGVGVVRVAAVAAHGQAVQLAHEVILKGGADDLLMVVQVFRADEADHRIDHERLVAAGQPVTAGLHRHLIAAVMRVRRQRGTLPRLEVHDVGPGGLALSGALAAGCSWCLIASTTG